jgi:hypothetical protein
MAISRSVKQCSICQHRERAAIDLALARGVSGGAIAKRYRVGPRSVYRHAEKHLPPQLRASLLAGPNLSIDVEKLRADEGQSFLAGLIALRHRLWALLDAAEEHGDANMGSRVAGQLHKNYELVGQHIGGLSRGTTVNNVLVAPIYIEVRAELIRALLPYPEAKEAVTQALIAIEARAAAEIDPNVFEAAPT